MATIPSTFAMVENLMFEKNKILSLAAGRPTWGIFDLNISHLVGLNLKGPDIAYARELQGWWRETGNCRIDRLALIM